MKLGDCLGVVAAAADRKVSQEAIELAAHHSCDPEAAQAMLDSQRKTLIVVDSGSPTLRVDYVDAVRNPDDMTRNPREWAEHLREIGPATIDGKFVPVVGHEAWKIDPKLFDRVPWLRSPARSKGRYAPPLTKTEIRAIRKAERNRKRDARRKQR